ncbi:MAG: cation transporter [Clostridia bacterium]|nr:cation transporter [Clostridia bacterium]
MNQKKIEKQSLIVSAIVNFIMAAAGIAVFILTKLQSLFLDAFFSVFAFLSNIMALIFSKVSKKRNSAYPTGMYFLEPLYGIIKSFFIFALLVESTVESGITAYNYFAKGIGTTVNLAPILPYTLIMLILCFGLYFFNKHQNKKINNISTMLTAESKSNLVDGIISVGIGVLIMMLYFININGNLGFLHYTGDFFITVILVAVSIKEPIKLFSMSLREISGATIKDKEIKKIVRKIISKEIKDENLDNKFEIYKIGKHIKVVILIEEIIDQEVLTRLKTDALKEIKATFDSVTIEYVIRKS